VELICDLEKELNIVHFLPSDSRFRQARVVASDHVWTSRKS
jgi:hypothetical protein